MSSASVSPREPRGFASSTVSVASSDDLVSARVMSSSSPRAPLASSSSSAGSPVFPAASLARANTKPRSSSDGHASESQTTTHTCTPEFRFWFERSMATMLQAGSDESSASSACSLDLTGKMKDAYRDSLWLASQIARQPHIRSLVLDSNRLTPACLFAVGDAVSNMPFLQHLSLSGNPLGVLRVSDEALQRDRGYTFDLQDGEAPEGFYALRDCIRFNSTLTRLDVRNASLSPASVCVLADMLRDNKSLVHVDLRGNDVALRGGWALVDALRLNRTVCEIQLDGDNVGRSYWRVLQQRLSENRSTRLQHDPSQNAANARDLLQAALQEAGALREQLHAEHMHREQEEKKHADEIAALRRQLDESNTAASKSSRRCEGLCIQLRVVREESAAEIALLRRSLAAKDAEYERDVQRLVAQQKELLQLLHDSRADLARATTSASRLSTELGASQRALHAGVSDALSGMAGSSGRTAGDIEMRHTIEVLERRVDAIARARAASTAAIAASSSS